MDFLTRIVDFLARFLRFLLVERGELTLVAVLGLLAVWLLLPRPRSRARIGAALGALALFLAGALIVRAGAVTAEVFLFYAFSGIALVSGGLLVTQSNPARAALSFALVVLSTCGLFLLQAAPFLMAATTIVYAGAIVVTFLFVIMLAQQSGAADADRRSREPLFSAATGFVLLFALLYVLHTSYGTEDIDGFLAKVRRAKEAATVEEMAKALGDEDDKNKAFFDGFKKAVLKEQDRVNVYVGDKVLSPAQRLAAEVTTIYSDQWLELLAKDKPPVADARKLLDRLDDVGLRARQSFAVLTPRSEHPLSPLSGPPANTPLHGEASLRRDADGRPRLPAENTAYLGRSLFTDHLLAVELAGTLLLVATVGAIAIAHRRGERNA